MTPISYTVKNGITYFHYSYSDLKWFLTEGNKNGDVGMILTKRDGLTLYYRGFGVCSAPIKRPMTFIINHIPHFGDMPNDDQMLIPPKPLHEKWETRIITIDL
jgi:hypothetical protein